MANPNVPSGGSGDENDIATGWGQLTEPGKKNDASGAQPEESGGEEDENETDSLFADLFEEESSDDTAGSQPEESGGEEDEDETDSLFADLFEEKSSDDGSSNEEGPRVYSPTDGSNVKRKPLHESENTETLMATAADFGVPYGQIPSEEEAEKRELDTNAKNEEVQKVVEAYSDRGVVRDREMAKKVFDILETEPESVFGIFKHRLFQGVRNLEDDASEPYDGEIYTDIVLLDEALSRGIDFSDVSFDMQYKVGGEADKCDVKTILERMKKGLDKKLNGWPRRIDPSFATIKDPFNDEGGQRSTVECLDELIAKFDKQPGEQ